MKNTSLKTIRFNKRVIRSRKTNPQISNRLRLAVFRGTKNITAQIIDDKLGKTLAYASSIKIKEKLNKTKLAELVGKDIATQASAKKITEVYFDRRGYLYHGRVKALAESARSHGLIF